MPEAGELVQIRTTTGLEQNLVRWNSTSGE
jgi:hypothetical protein